MNNSKSDIDEPGDAKLNKIAIKFANACGMEALGKRRQHIIHQLYVDFAHEVASKYIERDKVLETSEAELEEMWQKGYREGQADNAFGSECIPKAKVLEAIDKAEPDTNLLGCEKHWSDGGGVCTCAENERTAKRYILKTRAEIKKRLGVDNG